VCPFTPGYVILDNLKWKLLTRIKKGVKIVAKVFQGVKRVEKKFWRQKKKKKRKEKEKEKERKKGNLLMADCGLLLIGRMTWVDCGQSSDNSNVPLKPKLIIITFSFKF